MYIVHYDRITTQAMNLAFLGQTCAFIIVRSHGVKYHYLHCMG